MRLASSVHGDRITTTVCVIGSGPTGQTVARRVAATGIPVLMLEAGGLDRGRVSQRLSASVMPTVGDPYPNLADVVGVGLGGTVTKPSIALAPTPGSQTGIRLRPLDPVDLETREALAIPGWPLTYERLLQANVEVAHSFGIRSLDHDKGLQILGHPSLASAAFHIADRRPFSDPDLSGLENLTVLLEAAVIRLEVGRDGRISTAVIAAPGGRRISVHADVFVMAMSAGSTSRLLLSSSGPDGPVAGSSGLVGRYLMDHPLVTTGWITPGPRWSTAIEPFTARWVDGDLIWPKLISHPDQVRSGALPQSWATLVPSRLSARMARLSCAATGPEGVRTAAPEVVRRWADEISARRVPVGSLRDVGQVVAGLDDIFSMWFCSRSGYRPTWTLEDPFWAMPGRPTPPAVQILQMSEQLPDPNNRLILTEQTDRLGRPKTRLHWRWTKADELRSEAFARIVREALTDSGLGRITAPVTVGRRSVEKWSTHHLSGGARMSADPAAGVVNPSCRSHDHDNLYITGTSVFPTNGHTNPTLTAMAMAVIASDAICGTAANETEPSAFA